MPRDYTKGQFLIGEPHPVEDRRRAAIRKGAFLISTPIAKPAPLPKDLQEFESAAAEADRLAAIGYQEIQTRINRVRGRIAELQAGVKP